MSDEQSARAAARPSNHVINRRAALALPAAAALTALSAATAGAATAGGDAAVFNAYDDWQAALKTYRTLELSHDLSNEYDAVCQAAWVVQTEAGERLAELTAATPQGAATQLRWLLSRLDDGTLPEEAQELLARVAALLDDMAGAAA